MKIAIVHYWFITRRGGEKVVESILKKFPSADIYTLFYDKKKYGNYLEGHKIYSSIFDISFFRKNYQKIFPLYPLAIKSLKLKDNYDLVISSESGPAKGIKISNNTKHVCYIHSPMRYCWSHKDVYVNSVSHIMRPLMRFFLRRLRDWDLTTINNVDLYLSNSKNIAERVKKYYNKQSVIVYPPIDEKLFNKPLRLNHKKEYYLSFGAITPYKRIDLLVDTFNKNKKQLIIVGDGSEKSKLMKKSNKNIQFLGTLDEEELEKVFSKSKALLFPGEEDFGMIPLEVMAFGIPVIAYNKGGALETVLENRNKIEESSGLFFSEQSTNSLLKTINFFEKVADEFNPVWIRNYARRFSENKFHENFSMQLESFLKKESIEET